MKEETITIAEVASKAVDSLTTALNNIAPQAWEAMVEGTRVNAIGEATTSVLMLMPILFVWPVVRRLVAKEEEEPGAAGFFYDLAVIYSVVSLLMFCVALASLPGEVANVLTPERGVILQILEATK